jgi:hypothetical protein
VTGNEYADLIASYLVARFGAHDLVVYREVSIGKSIIGKNRKLDILTIARGRAFAIECKYQESQGTAEEKIPYTLADLAALQMSGCVAYAGAGFSPGVIHMLEASELAAYCLPLADLTSSRATRELDHLLAMHYGWWDLLVAGKKPFTLPPR